MCVSEGLLKAGSPIGLTAAAVPPEQRGLEAQLYLAWLPAYEAVHHLRLYAPVERSPGRRATGKSGTANMSM